MFSGASVAITGGMINNATNLNIIQAKRGIDILMDWVATDAFHNSKELYDAPKCHPHTRVAVLNNIMKWVIECEAQDEFLLWLFGPAGAGKSAIAKKIAELAAEKGLLIGSFFFSRTSPTRNTKDRLIATLAYQMTLSIPDTRYYIEGAIEQDPAIFHKTIESQIDTLLIKPFQSTSTQTVPIPKLIIIDGLDECMDGQAQISILDSISHSFIKHKLPVVCLIASRPETDLVSSFNGNEPIKSIHRRLALDNTYHPEDDIRRFLSDKFNQIRCNHRLKSTIPLPWPTGESLQMLVDKSSGQFIFAATVVKFVESNRHRPAERLNVILGISPPGTINPFTELDALYKQILSSVDDIQLTLHVLSLYTSSPRLADQLRKMSEQFLLLEEGDIDRALIDLSSIVSYDEPSGEVTILHASFVDFLFDKRRSDAFHIDMANAHTDFTCRTLQYVKGPDGMRAGDINVFASGISERGCILNDQLRREILNFDLDAFITAVIKSPYPRQSDAISWIFGLWMSFIVESVKMDGAGDAQLLTHRCRDSFESRIQKYQSDWRLQLLLTFALVMDHSSSQIPSHTPLSIFLEMDDSLYLVDQHALDLRYSEGFFTEYTRDLRDITSRYVDGDRYASAALHCMRFLTNPPSLKSSVALTGSNIPENAIIRVQWRSTCKRALKLLYGLLERAKTSPELIQFMNDHDIDTTLQKNLPDRDIWEADMKILSFLSRGDVCVNWRIIVAIQRALSSSITWINNPKYRQASARSKSREENALNMEMYEPEENTSDIMSVENFQTS